MYKFRVKFRNEVLYGIMDENDDINVFSYLESVDKVLKKINKKDYNDNMNFPEDNNLDIMSITKIGKRCINYDGQFAKEREEIIYERGK